MRIVELASEPLYNRLGIWKVYLFLVENLLIFVLVITVIVMIASKIDILATTISAGLLLAIVILKVLESIIKRPFFSEHLKNKVANRARIHYIKFIRRKVSANDIQYTDRIIENCIEHTSCFKKYTVISMNGDKEQGLTIYH